VDDRDNDRPTDIKRWYKIAITTHIADRVSLISDKKNLLK